MTAAVVLLSGSVASGKSAIATVLLDRHGFRPISSGAHLRQLAEGKGLPPDRITLQELGDQLDVASDFSWIVDDVASRAVASSPDQLRWLVDAVRKRRQVEHFRQRFKSIWHVHILAPESILRQRYVARLMSQGVSEELAGAEYDRAVAHPNEQEARSLGTIADVQFDTSSMSPERIAAAISH